MVADSTSLTLQSFTLSQVKNPEQMFVRSEKEAMPVLQAHSAFAAEARAQDLLQGTSVPGQGPHTSPTLPQSPTAPHSPNHSGSFGTTTSMPLHSPPGAATDVQLDTVPSEAIIAACIRHTDHKGALSWFDAMKDAGLRSGRSKCSVCVAINACTDAKDAAGVVRWYTAVLAAGGAVNENTFNLAIKAFAHAGDVSGAEAWISAMWKVTHASEHACTLFSRSALISTPTTRVAGRLCSECGVI